MGNEESCGVESVFIISLCLRCRLYSHPSETATQNMIRYPQEGPLQGRLLVHETGKVALHLFCYRPLMVSLACNRPCQRQTRTHL